MFFQLIPKDNLSILIRPILQMKKLRLEEAKIFTQNNTARDSNLSGPEAHSYNGLLIPEYSAFV